MSSTKIVTSSIVVPNSSKRSSSHNEAQDINSAVIDRKFSVDSMLETKRTRIDNSEKTRGQRLFGFLKGTLNKFKIDSEIKTEAEVKRDMIVEKLNEKIEKDKKESHAEAIKKAEEKRERLLKFQAQEKIKREADLKELNNAYKKNLCHFIATETAPKIYYMPFKHNEFTTGKLDKQQGGIITKKEIENGLSHNPIPEYFLESKDVNVLSEVNSNDINKKLPDIHNNPIQSLDNMLSVSETQNSKDDMEISHDYSDNTVLSEKITKIKVKSTIHAVCLDKKKDIKSGKVEDGKIIVSSKIEDKRKSDKNK